MASSSSSFTATCWYIFCVFMILGWGCCNGFKTFGFDIHHRFSDPVKGILPGDGLPEKGTVEYYAVMAHRDRIIHGRLLASTVDQTLLTFSSGNETYQIPALGQLHYANVSVGTPSLSFLVALDTGSDLFWLPCDCTSCIRALASNSTSVIDLNIYSPNTSTTSSKVPCNSTMCARGCSSTHSDCPYQVEYLSNNTSSTGFLVEDVLRLTTDDNQIKPADARITFGCGKVQTGAFLDGAAPNGLFGLGIDSVSVPSILAKEGVVSNSFSMCFGSDGIGRISFGDKGSSDQGETPFNLRKSHPTYNISITQISVGDKTDNLNFSAIFDTGTSFTYLNDPAYTLITESFDSQAYDQRQPSDSELPFDYCYGISQNATNFTVPSMNLTMEGGDIFYVFDPIIVARLESGGLVYCLAVVKSEDVNLIGQNFMTGHRIVFDREKMVLGWKVSSCYDSQDTSTVPINPNSTAAPPVPVNPEATAGSSNGSHISGAPPPLANYPRRLTHVTYAVVMVFLAILF